MCDEAINEIENNSAEESTEVQEETCAERKRRLYEESIVKGE